MQAIDALPTSLPKPLILLTGGLRTPEQMRKAVDQRDCDLLGLGRLSVLRPDFPKRLRSQPDYVAEEPDLPKLPWFPKLLGAGVGTAWYVVQIRRIAEGKSVDMKTGGIESILLMWIRRPYLLLLLGAMITIILIGFMSVK